MPTLSSSTIPAPSNWQDFESLCCDLWREIWRDSNAQRNGRQGQPQQGVDICGRPNRGNQWAGVQCKGKVSYSNKKLTADELKTEVEKAKTFNPALSEYIIATTGPKDAKIEELAREITNKHLRNGLFSVHIWSWNDIAARLADFPNLIRKHYPEFNLNADALERVTNEIEKIGRNMDKLVRYSQQNLEISAEVRELVFSSSKSMDTTQKFIDDEYRAELDHARDLINDYKPRKALQSLNELRNRWLDAPQIIKYRLLTDMGRAKLYLNQDQEAAEFLIEAWQYNPEEDKSLSNRALGHLLLNQIGKARYYAKKALEENPTSSHAYSILAQTFFDEEELEDIIVEIPESYRTTLEVSHTFGRLARKRGNLAEAKKWLETAIENDKSDSSDLKAELGEVLLQLVMEDKSIIYAKQLSSKQKKQVQKALQLLTSAWKKVANTEIRDSRVSWIASRGLAKRLLEDPEGAIKDTEIALRAEPSDPTFIMNRAILAYENNDSRTAISLARQILSSKETPGAVLLLARALREESEFSEAIKILEDFLETNPPEEMKEETQRLLIPLYIDSGDFLAARNLSNSMRATDPTNVLFLVDAARISKISDNPEEAVLLLREAAEHVTISSLFREFLELADEFFFLEQYKDAISIYERFVDKSLKTPFTYRLLDCYYRSGETGQALKICQNLREKYGPLEFVSEMEATIHESIGDLEEARNVCREYWKKFPEDLGMNLRRAVINFRLNNFGEVDEFLDSLIDINELSMEHGFLLARLYAARDSIKKAFETIYEIRRNFPNNGNAHVNYTMFFFHMEKDSYEWLRPTKVEKDTAVCVRDESGHKKWYIIEDRKDWDTLRGEISLEHHLAQKLMGKSVGDEVLIEESQFSTEYGKIIEIKSKYVHALHESISLVPKMFPDISGIWKIKVGSIVEEGEFTEGFQKILDMITSRYETLKKVEQFYREKRMPIGTFAKLVGRNVLDVWEDLRRDPELGINCCFGTVEERNYAASLLEKKTELITDIVSLMTLHEIGAQDIAVETFGKLGIAQSTIDLLQYVIDERKSMRSRGFATIWKEEDEYRIHRNTAEEVERDIERLEGIMDWVRRNCNVIPCRAALNMTVEDRQKYNDMVGQSFIDTILIASEPGNMLYSDDVLLRSFAKGEFDADGVWTQVLLMYSIEKKTIEKNEYDKIVIRLACSHYHFTSIDAGVLIEAAKQSKWLPSCPYTTVLQILGEGSSDEISALNVGTEFLCRLWSAQISPGQRDLLVHKFLDVIVAERDTILENLKSNVKRRFSSQSLDESRAIFSIDLWTKMHTV